MFVKYLTIPISCHPVLWGDFLFLFLDMRMDHVTVPTARLDRPNSRAKKEDRHQHTYVHILRHLQMRFQKDAFSVIVRELSLSSCSKNTFEFDSLTYANFPLFKIRVSVSLYFELHRNDERSRDYQSHFSVILIFLKTFKLNIQASSLA